MSPLTTWTWKPSSRCRSASSTIRARWCSSRTIASSWGDLQPVLLNCDPAAASPTSAAPTMNTSKVRESRRKRRCLLGLAQNKTRGEAGAKPRGWFVCLYSVRGIFVCRAAADRYRHCQSHRGRGLQSRPGGGYRRLSRRPDWRPYDEFSLHAQSRALDSGSIQELGTEGRPDRGIRFRAWMVD